jgi:hypothetical protein
MDFNGGSVLLVDVGVPLSRVRPMSEAEVTLSVLIPAFNVSPLPAASAASTLFLSAYRVYGPRRVGCAVFGDGRSF